VLVGLLVGAKLVGIGGVILAVPTLIIVTTFIEDFVEERKQEENRLEKT
jgi:predicted PurR-regulated permease PerM